VQTFQATITDQGLEFRSPAYLRHLLGKLGIGTTVFVTIDARKPKRSNQQNAYYWVILAIMAEDTGHTSNELHDQMDQTNQINDLNPTNPINSINPKNSIDQTNQTNASQMSENRSQRSVMRLNSAKDLDVYKKSYQLAMKIF